MKHFLRRKSSRIAAEEKSNKNNAKLTPALPAIVDHEPDDIREAPPMARAGDTDRMPIAVPDRRSSATETISSTSSGQDAKKKDSYMSRLAAESRESPQLSPWMAMSGTSHLGVKAGSKPRPRLGPPIPIRVSEPPRAKMDTIPLSEAPVGDYHQGIGIAVDGVSSFPNSRPSVVIPPSPTSTVSPPGPSHTSHRSSIASMPSSPPMPSYPPPAPPPGVPVGTLANPFREEASPTDIGEPMANPHAARPPPPPPPPAKIQRSPTKPSVPPPSAFIMHKRSPSGRTSPGPSSFRKLSLPSPPVPPPPPPAPANDQNVGRANDLGNGTFTEQPTSPTWDSWVPDLTGYYGGNPSFVAELDNTEAPTPPAPALAGGDERLELEHTTGTQNDQLQAEEDIRETSKVLLPPDGTSLRAITPEPTTNGHPQPTEYLQPPDTVLLSNAEHNSLLAELAKLRAQLADVDKLHKASQARVAEWEAYRVSMDKYVDQLTTDRQTIIEKLNSSEQALSEKDRHAKQLHASLNDWQAHAKAIEAHTQRIEADKAETISQLTTQIDQLHNQRAEASQELESRTSMYELTKTQMSSHISHLEMQDRDTTARLTNTENERKRLTTELLERERAIEEWKTHHDAAAAARNSTTKELQALKAQVVNMSSEAEKMKARLEDAERTKAELAEAREKMERMKETEQTLEKFVRTTTEEKDKLRELLKASTAARGRLGAALSEAEAQMKERDAKIQTLERASAAQKKRMYMLGQRMAEKVEWWDGQVGAQRAAA
ncbi:hypothetical protein Dda_8390 [Drechslerella dactyloides]|uniref:Uncharacterized protein n=1 Tax=Drechslerella dactyloides TaxID=74499 RepID=A0AAD6IQG5_DREDA|nr:hypothetical protein Dda_8390 [Drechslerella dactyloides]